MIIRCKTGGIKTDVPPKVWMKDETDEVDDFYARALISTGHFFEEIKIKEDVREIRRRK